MKVFISQPMIGFSREDVFEEKAGGKTEIVP